MAAPAPLPAQALSALRSASESSLFYFSRVVLGLKFLTQSLHQDLAVFLQNPSKPRKLCLIPRDHAKTTLIKAQIIHSLIQPAAANIYFPGCVGTDTRIILAGETSKNAARHLRSIESVLEKNQMLRTLWPHLKPGPKWSEHEMELVRSTPYSEPTVEALGTDTAIASRHVDWIFCDDIYTFEAMMSPSVSERVNLWFTALEPILDETENSSAKLTVTGTPWAERDVYKQILNSLEEGESDYEVYTRSVIENGQPIWPERFSLARLSKIEVRSAQQGLWYLNWMCSYGQSEFNDFRDEWLKQFELVLTDDGWVIDRDDGRRISLRECDVVQCYDPARTRESSHKGLARSAIMTTACDGDYNVYVLAYFAARQSLEKIYAAIVEQSNAFRPRCLGIEDVATQVAIGDAFGVIAELKKDELPPLISLRPDTANNKIWRIKAQFQRVAPYGRFYIQKHMVEFRSEWSAFPNGRTIDILDVGAYCIDTHNIPDDAFSQSYNTQLRRRREASNVIYLDEYERDESRYVTRTPPEDWPARGALRLG